MSHEPEVCHILINRELLLTMIWFTIYLKENNFDFSEAPPPLSSLVFNLDIDLPSPPPPEPASEPLKPICKLKWCETLQDMLPEEPGPIDMRPEPEPEPPQATAPV
jgi:hypothetical protein